MVELAVALKSLLSSQIQRRARGFSPITAGNVRLDGLYFDQQGGMFDQLVTDTRIRVGMSALNFPWPAPTGIVDYTLREPKDSPSLTSITYLGPYDSRDIDLDGQTKLWNGTDFGIAAGASYHHDEYIPGQRGRSVSFGILPQWRPTPKLSVKMFWGRANILDQETLPAVYVSSGQALPRIAPRYFGQSWTLTDDDSEHYGILVNGRLSRHWSVRAGVFRSIFDLPRSFSDLYKSTLSNGIASHSIVAEPDQYYGSTSGEIQLTSLFQHKAWHQRLDIGVRGRNVSNRYGGAETIDFGVGLAGQLAPLPSPRFQFSAKATNGTHEYAVGISYSLEWHDTAELAVAVRHPNYFRTVDDPVLGSSTISMSPWVYNSSITLHPTTKLTVFGAITHGLEDSGIAPASAANRGAVLDAARSSQVEMGLGYALSPSLRLRAGLFDVRKPYFALNEQNLFGDLGQERHRGAELSVAGELTSRLNVVAGMLLMTPEVMAPNAQQPVGTRPIGQSNRMVQLNLRYSLPWLANLSIDCVFNEIGSRAASVDNRLEIPSHYTFDTGLRYQTTLGGHAATLRIQAWNITNSSNWFILGDGGLLPIAARRASAYVILDL